MRHPIYVQELTAAELQVVGRRLAAQARFHVTALPIPCRTTHKTLSS